MEAQLGAVVLRVEQLFRLLWVPQVRELAQ
jgi:hypothetical protein